MSFSEIRSLKPAIQVYLNTGLSGNFKRFEKLKFLKVLSLRYRRSSREDSE